MRLILSTNLNRKSGYVLGYFQPDLSNYISCDYRKEQPMLGHAGWRPFALYQGTTLVGP